MSFMVPCRRCGVDYDFDADRRLNPHGHGPEPHPSDHPAGTRVRLLRAERSIEVGAVLTVRDYSPPHHTQNGGGYSVSVLEVEGYHDIRSYHLEVVADHTPAV